MALLALHGHRVARRADRQAGRAITVYTELVICLGAKRKERNTYQIRQQLPPSTPGRRYHPTVARRAHRAHECTGTTSAIGAHNDTVGMYCERWLAEAEADSNILQGWGQADRARTKHSNGGGVRTLPWQCLAMEARQLESRLHVSLLSHC
jgi:hypothetical protein